MIHAIPTSSLSDPKIMWAFPTCVLVYFFPGEQTPLIPGKHFSLHGLNIWRTFLSSASVSFHLSFSFSCLLSFSLRKPLLFIRFVRSGQYVNPSRISPVELRSYKTMSPKGDSRQLYVDSGKIAICLSAICATTSFLFTPQEKKGIIQRTLAGRFHTQEWERYCACIGMVFGHTKMNAQYDDGALSFTSKSDGRTCLSFLPFTSCLLSSYTATPASASLPSDMFSPGKKARGGIKPVLNYDDESKYNGQCITCSFLIICN